MKFQHSLVANSFFQRILLIQKVVHQLPFFFNVFAAIAATYHQLPFFSTYLQQFQLLAHQLNPFFFNVFAAIAVLVYQLPFFQQQHCSYSVHQLILFTAVISASLFISYPFFQLYL
jgi:hypothetical protein